MTSLQAIRQKVIEREYYLSSHAEDEMIDDNLERDDIENAILIITVYALSEGT